MQLTDALRQEHLTMRRLLGYMTEQAAVLKTRDEILILAGVLEHLLALHGDDEENFLLATLDHLEEHQGTLTMMHQQHGELDGHLRALAQIQRLPALRARFLQLIDAVEQHFQFEERAVFPLLEKYLPPALLAKLGSVVGMQPEAQPAGC
jgi:hypothetical protein